MAQQGFAIEIAELMPTALESGFFNSLCTVQQRTGAVSATGQPDLTDWVDIPEFTDLVCMVSIDRPTLPDMAAVVRKPQELDTMTLIHVLLAGYYPGILQQNQLVVTTGSYAGSYEIMAVEPDSQETQTRLAVRVWTQ